MDDDERPWLTPVDAGLLVAMGMQAFVVVLVVVTTASVCFGGW